MNEKIIETIVTSFIKELISSGKEVFSDVYDEAKQIIGQDLKNYLEKQRKRYSYVKTLLRGNTPVFLYDIYYPLNLENENKRVISTSNIKDVFRSSNFITIVGDAGSGKSTLVKHLVINSVELKYGIPVLIELRYLNDTTGDIEEYIINTIFESKISQNNIILERLLRNGKFIFFLDGYDEINSDIKLKVIGNLNTFMTQYNNNKFILTTRPYTDIEHLQSYTNYRIKSLNEEEGQIDGFIDLQLGKESELSIKIKKSIKDESSNVYITSFLTNPLLLTLYILTFQSYAEIPSKKFIFYRRVINALFSEHDSKTKVGYVREKLSKLSQEQFEDTLKAFCFLSYFDSKFSYGYDYIVDTLKKIKSKLNFGFENTNFINDLKSAVCLWVEDNGIYSFAHRSLQEFFAASFIKKLNEDEKKRVYEKIIEKYSLPHERRNTEIDNLLSLCYEMDELDFYKYYYYPLLCDLNIVFESNDNREICKKILNFLLTPYTWGNKKNKIIFQINESVYKSLRLHLKFTRSIVYRVRELFNDNVEINDSGITSNNLSTAITIQESFLTSNNSNIIKIINDREIIRLSKELFDYILNEHKRVKGYIDDNNKFNKEFVDLI